jgi:transposase, IS30 family
MARQLNMEERELLAQMWFAGRSKAEIGRALERHPTTIGRELARNGEPDGSYRASSAQRQTQQRRRERPLTRKLEIPEIKAFVRSSLARCWSPDQIAGRLRREFPHDRRRRVSHQTVYVWIRQQAAPARQHWESLLRRGGRKKPREDGRGRITGQVSIEGRPSVVDRRERFGDWEGDTLIGRRHRGAVVTLVERKSGYLLAAQSQDRQARRIRRKIEGRVAGLPPELRRTVTFDNGKEFAEHELLARRTGLDVYFAQPYCSWQRGTNENTNGLLRQFFPKGTDFLALGPSTLNRTVRLLNHRPRKRLDYRTPHEVLHQAGFPAFES